MNRKNVDSGGNIYPDKLAIPPREVAGGKPAKTGGDVPLPQKSDRRKLFLWLCEHTACGRGLGTGDRRQSRHAQIIKKRA